MNNSGRTAIHRSKLSRPMKYLQDAGKLKGRCLDFGCGHGDDAAQLKMARYDLNHWARKPTGLFDTITCHYVLNVLPEDERKAVVRDVMALLRSTGTAYFTVRRDIKEDYTTKAGTQQYVVDLPFEVEHSISGSYTMYRRQR